MIKQANIGFDVRGDVKIFDFGLARIMPQDGNPYTDEFEMSGAGSPRYMAPEVLNLGPYNLKSDVYTFSIVVWEILSNETPYMFVRKRTQLINYIVNENGRPKIDSTWPMPIQGMLETSFDSDLGRRPVSQSNFGLTHVLSLISSYFTHNVLFLSLRQENGTLV